MRIGNEFRTAANILFTRLRWQCCIRVQILVTPLILRAAFFLHRGHLGFSLNLDLRQDRDDLAFYTIEHRRKHLERFTLVLLLGILLSIARRPIPWRK